MSGAKNKAKDRQSRAHKASYQAYAADQRREVNKAKRLMRHLKRFPNHEQALKTLEALPAAALKKARRETAAAIASRA